MERSASLEFGCSVQEGCQVRGFMIGLVVGLTLSGYTPNQDASKPDGFDTVSHALKQPDLSRVSYVAGAFDAYWSIRILSTDSRYAAAVPAMLTKQTDCLRASSERSLGTLDQHVQSVWRAVEQPQTLNAAFAMFTRACR